MGVGGKHIAPLIWEASAYEARFAEGINALPKYQPKITDNVHAFNYRVLKMDSIEIFR